jgi:DNA-directed RNA polymerase subunit RPC12/RpoP
MNLVWKPVNNMKSNPESVYNCPTCNNEVFCHINYIQAGIPACIRVQCGNAEEISRRMVEYRGWRFISTELGKHDRIVNFICDKSHENSLIYKGLKKGGGCKDCINQNMKKDKVETKVNRTCECRKRVCEHYNHGIFCPKSVDEWSQKNKVSPFELAPRSMTKYLFDCSDCGREFSQTLDKRFTGQNCPYCNGVNLVSYERSLAYKYPDLIEEWDLGNKKTPDQVFYSSNHKYKWKCKTCSHKWDANVNQRTSKKQGCPKCNHTNYDAMVGGHDYFVIRANELHGNKYQYLEKYINSDTKIAISCPVHGIFKQEPFVHLRGNGCPTCYIKTTVSKGEHRICVILDRLGEEYQMQKTFPGLIYQKELRCDFYLPKHNLVIEFDGEQHFTYTRWTNDPETSLNEGKEKDRLKDRYMIRNRINLLRIPYNRFDQIETMIIDAIEKCKHGHLYASYPEHIVRIREQENLEGINVLQITHIKLVIVKN